MKLNYFAETDTLYIDIDNASTKDELRQLVVDRLPAVDKTIAA